jgi:transglutaminase-like putative cysteine protease
MKEQELQYLMPSAVIDSDQKEVRAFAFEVAGRSSDPVEIAVELYLAVRDGIRYDPYSPFYLPEHYRASFVLKRGRSFCVPKASLLCALARARKIPSRVGFANVRNHLVTKQLLSLMGTDLFVYHGFVELFLEGKWVKATPAFNRELCLRHAVPPLEFNGREDSLFQPFNLKSQKFMEYVEFCGIYADIPVAQIVEAWKEAYGKDRVEQWMIQFQMEEGQRLRQFEDEDLLEE